MKDLLIKYPMIYLLLFCSLAGFAGVDTAVIIKNGFPQQKGIMYLKIFQIVIGFTLSFLFLVTFIKSKNKKEND